MTLQRVSMCSGRWWVGYTKGVEGDVQYTYAILTALIRQQVSLSHKTSSPGTNYYAMDRKLCN